MISVNGIQIKPTLFPDNTSQVWHIDPKLLERRYVNIDWDFEHEGELLQVTQVKDLLDRYGVDSQLRLSYLPYGRQDKEISNDTSFALSSFARLINSLKFKYVYCLDPHSDRAAKLIHNFCPISPTEYIQAVINEVKPDIICYPDEGAKNRYQKIIDFPSVYAEKQRNQETGAIESLAIIGNPIEQKVLIVDDICDGGATFIRLTDMLKHLSKEVNLYTTHGIFSKGLQVLKESGINRVFTHKGEVSETQQQITYRSL